MTQVSPENLPSPPNSPPPADEPHGSWLGALWSGGQLLAALAVTAYVLYYLLTTPLGGHPDEADAAKGPPPAVEAAGPSLVRIRPGSKLDGRLKASMAEPVRTSSP